jgi:hypothetical protein
LGFGFLVLVLVHMVAMNSVATMEQRSRAISARGDDESRQPSFRRYALYRGMLRMATISAFVVLSGWLWMHREGVTAGPGTSGEAVASATDDRANVSR